MGVIDSTVSYKVCIFVSSIGDSRAQSARCWLISKLQGHHAAIVWQVLCLETSRVSAETYEMERPDADLRSLDEALERAVIGPLVRILRLTDERLTCFNHDDRPASATLPTAR